MPTISTTEPAALIAGDTAKWLKTLADYPASGGWVLSYELVNAAARISFGSTALDRDHLVGVPAATTAAWAPGAYTWRARVSQASEVYTVGGGQMQVQPAFATALDASSHARRTLEAINAVLEGRASSATAEYTIAGRSLKYIPLPELLALQSSYERKVRSEETAAKLAAGLGNPGRIYVRFGA